MGSIYFITLLLVYGPEYSLMKESGRTYIAIDLKSFYASVECVELGYDALDTCLVVADRSRSQKTICLAVSPALKAYGTGPRPRLFEVVQKVNEANRLRGYKKKSFSKKVLDADNSYAIDFIAAVPRMGLYLEYSRRIYEIYLRYISPEDIHVYSVDEVFIDATSYVELYKVSPHELAISLIRKVLDETGITATVGIGTNLYLAKVAMDIVAKKMPADKDGVRIAEIDEYSYRHELWDHLPLTDFWRVGRGVVNRLLPYGIITMGDIARCSLCREDLLYRLFGVNAELLIDHAWGWEPVTIPHIKAYRPESHSMSVGQVLQRPYECYEARNVILEMADTISLDMIEKNVVSDQVVITVGYDVESLTRKNDSYSYTGRVKTDHYGRKVPVHAQGTFNFTCFTSSGRLIVEKVGELYDRIVNPHLLIRRLNVCMTHLLDRNDPHSLKVREWGNLFTDFDELKRKQEKEKRDRLREYEGQKAVIEIKKKFGKNSILKGLNFAEGATQKERNTQIGGHKE